MEYAEIRKLFKDSDDKLEKKVDELHLRITKIKDEQTVDDKELRAVCDGLKTSFSDFQVPIAAMGVQCENNQDSIKGMNKWLIGTLLTALGALAGALFK